MEDLTAEDIEGWGTGLPRLFRQCREMGLPEPKFEEFGEGIKVTVYRADHEMGTGSEIGIKTNIETTASTETGTETSTETDTEKKILSLIAQNSSITIKEMSAASGLSVSGVRYVLKNLRNREILTREGAQKRGKWIIVKHN